MLPLFSQLDDSDLSVTPLSESGTYTVRAHRVVHHETLPSETIFGCELSIPGTDYVVREEAIYRHKKASECSSELYGVSAVFLGSTLMCTHVAREERIGRRLVYPVFPCLSMHKYSLSPSPQLPKNSPANSILRRPIFVSSCTGQGGEDMTLTREFMKTSFSPPQMSQKMKKKLRA